MAKPTNNSTQTVHIDDRANVKAMTFEQLKVYASEQGAAAGDGIVSFANVCSQAYLSGFKGTLAKSAANDVYAAYVNAKAKAAGTEMTSKEIEPTAAQVSKLAVFIDCGKLDHAEPSTVADMFTQVGRVLSLKLPALENVKRIEGTITAMRRMRDAGKVITWSDDELVAVLTPSKSEKDEGAAWGDMLKQAKKVAAKYGTPKEEYEAIVAAIEYRRKSIMIALAAEEKVKREASAATVAAQPSQQ